jgi:hypothetical protein
MRLYLVKTDGGDLIGYDAADAAYLAKLEPGECIESDTRKARNPAHHRKFFALFELAFQSQERYANRRQFMTELKVRAGWYEEYINADGKMVYVPMSISWANMDQERFDKFYADAVVALSGMCHDDEIASEADRIIATRKAA